MELGAHVIMPNHVHGIVIINKPNDERNDGKNPIRYNESSVETQDLASLQKTPTTQGDPIKPNNTKNKFGPQSKNLASIIRGYKIGVTKNARQFQPGFSWQSRYHDHIIRNENSLQNISQYIMDNPMNWERDRFYKE